MKRLAALLAILLMLPTGAFAQDTSDLGIYASDIRFSTSTLVAGSDIRIYASIHNEGEIDASAYVFFFQGSIPIGASQIVTVPADGEPDEVWVDFSVPSSAFNIHAEVRGQDPADSNAANDLALTTLFTPIFDADGDGIEDEDDNCEFVKNADQADADGDDQGDVCDGDDDNDGTDDDLENAQATDQFNPDTDGDGVDDGEDVAPLDASVQSNDQLEVEQEAEDNRFVDDADQPVSDANDVIEEPTEDRATEEEEVMNEGEDEDVLVSDVDDRESSSTLEVSPKAAFAYERMTWNTYRFTSLNSDSRDVEWQWAFEDGTTISGPETTFTFAGAGTHVVTLRVKDAEGFIVKDTAELTISFFHLGNPLALALLIALILLFILSTVAVFWYGKRARRRAQGAGAVASSVKSELEPEEDDVEEGESDEEAMESSEEEEEGDGDVPDEDEEDTEASPEEEEEEEEEEGADKVDEEASEDSEEDTLDEQEEEGVEDDGAEDEDDEMDEEDGGMMGIEEIGLEDEEPKVKKKVKAKPKAKAKPEPTKRRKTIKRKKS